MCGCNKNKGYLVTHPDGKTAKADSLSKAIAAARRTGGTYKRV